MLGYAHQVNPEATTDPAVFTPSHRHSLPLLRRRLGAVVEPTTDGQGDRKSRLPIARAS